MRAFRVAAVLAVAVALIAGCAGQPQIPYDRVPESQVRSIGIVEPGFPDGPTVFLASSVGQSLGPVGALIGAGMQARRGRLLLDAQGAVLRERPRKTFLFKESALYTGIRVHPGERYLTVASDPDSIGRQESQIVGSTRTTVLPVGTGFFMMRTGAEASRSVTYAHNGTVTVAARPLPNAD